MSKLIIVYPDFPGSKIINQEYSDPLGPLHIGTWLQYKGFEVSLVNCVVDVNWRKRLKDEAKDAVAVGISAMTEQLPGVLETAKIVKEELNLPVILAQVHATLLPEQCLRSPFIDYVILGEGENTIVELMKFLISKEGNLNDIGGLGFKDTDNNIRINANKKPFNFEAMPVVDYSLLSPNIYENLSKYGVGVLTSRGCPFGCLFCINSVIKENRVWRQWSAERVIKEIKNLVSLGVKEIVFWDECFFLNKKRVDKILDYLEEDKISIKWFGNARADFFKPEYLSREFLQRLEKNGLTSISIGAESGSQKMLNYMNKGTSPEMLLHSARLLGETNITCMYSFMIGLPGEEPEDMRATLNIMKQIQDIYPHVKFAGPQFYRPYPGSVLYNQCVDSGWQPPNSLEEWSRKIENEFLQADPFKSPWVKNPRFVTTVWFYSIFLVISYRQAVRHFINFCRNNKKGFWFTILGVVAIIIIITIGKLRYKLNFHYCQFEIRLLKRFRAALSS